MPFFVCLQAGHYPRTSGSTGAPGEQELNWRITLRLSEILQSKGFMIQIVGADPLPNEINKDFSLFLSLHGDADIYGTGGGCIASGDPSVDLSWKESARIRDAIAVDYFHHSEIVNHPERVNLKMTKYYMWAKLTDKTPCVILEMGVVQDAHDKVLLADTERIASAIARGVCSAFGVAYDPIVTPPPEPTPPPPDSPPPSPPPLPSPPPPTESENQQKLIKVKDIVWGKGWPWTKVRRIKELLPK